MSRSFLTLFVFMLQSCGLVLNLDLSTTADFISSNVSSACAENSSLNLYQNPTCRYKVQKLSGGADSYCALSSEGDVYCWGSNTYGQLGSGDTQNYWKPNRVDTSSLGNIKFKDVAISDYSSCAISVAGDVYCWGRNNAGQLGNSSNVNSYTPVAVTTSGVLAGKKIEKIKLGSYTACAIANDDNAYCWGAGWYGQLGNNTTSSSNQPVAVYTAGVLSGKKIVDLSLGGESLICALADDGRAYCWGENWAGQLGNNLTVDSSVPVAVDFTGALSGKTIKSISAGNYHACAVASDDRVYCWGYNWERQLGDGTTTDSAVPVAVSTSGALSGKNIDSVILKSDQSCAVGDNLIYCWGNTASGPTSLSTASLSSTLNLNQLELTNSSYCALTSDSQVYCRGGGFALGREYHDKYLTPTAVYDQDFLNSKNITKIYNVQTSLYGHTSDGGVFSLGTGNIGNDTSESFFMPIAYTKNDGDLVGKTLMQVTPAGNHSCSIDSTNLGYCWNTTNTWTSSNSYGSLGNGTTTDSTSATAIDVSAALSGKTLQKIVTVDRASCALASDNQVYCWGYNGYGILGVNNSTSNYSVASAQAINMTGDLAGKSVKEIQASSSIVCIIASDDWMYCWGWNGNGQIGDGTTAHKYQPTAVKRTGALAGLTIKAMSVGTGGSGQDSTCVVASDSKLYCWGVNASGQLGNNSTTNSNEPVAVDASGVISGKLFTSVSTNNATTCALSADYRIYCWGSNSRGQLGNNGTINSSVPVAVDLSQALSQSTSFSDLTVVGNYVCVLNQSKKMYCWGLNQFSGQLSETQNFGVFYGLE